MQYYSFLSLRAVALKWHITFGICDGRILAFRHAGTEVNFCFIVEDNICRLIINVKPKLKLIKDLLLIASTSSPAIANTFVGCRFSSSLRQPFSTSPSVYCSLVLVHC